MKGIYLAALFACLSVAGCGPRHATSVGGAGVVLVFQVDWSSQQGDHETLLAETERALERRGKRNYYKAVSIKRKGADQFVVEVTTSEDAANVAKVFGSGGRLQFFGAGSVVGPRRPYARFVAEDSGTGKDPQVSFTTKSGENISYLLADPKDPGKKVRNPKYADIIAGWGAPILEGPDIQDASVDLNTAHPLPLMRFSAVGGHKMERWSRANPEGMLAIVLDGKVLNINHVKEGEVLRDGAIIEGVLDVEFVKTIVGILNSGSLPVDLRLISSSRIGEDQAESAPMEEANRNAAP